MLLRADIANLTFVCVPLLFLESSVDAVHRIIKIFGTTRCFFASNYPVDVKDGWPAPKLFAAFKKLASQYDEDAQKGLFAGNAKYAYRV